MKCFSAALQSYRFKTFPWTRTILLRRQVHAPGIHFDRLEAEPGLLERTLLLEIDALQMPACSSCPDLDAH
jgi:hypothetical protein